jgi:nitrogen fixation NifU-like protein
MDLYQKQIIDHYKTPRNFGELKGDTVSSRAENPSCGDSISMSVRIEDNKIKDIKFSGNGCAISIASASMLTDKVKGMEMLKIVDLDFEFVQEMLGIKVTEARKRCAMLPLNVLKKIVLKELKTSRRSN